MIAPVPVYCFSITFTVYGCGGHLRHVPSIMSSDFHFLVPESFHTKFGLDRHSSFEKIQFEILHVHDLGPRPRNDLGLQYSYIFIYLIRCQLPLSVRSLATIVSEKSTVFTFIYRKDSGNKINLAVKQVKVILWLSFEQTMVGWISRCYIPSFVKIGLSVLVRNILKGFYHIWAWRPSLSCDPDAANRLSFPLPKEAPHKIWL